MPIHYVNGDPFLDSAQTLAVGFNARARQETSPFGMEVYSRYPAAFATLRKLVKHDRLHPGDLWVWRESIPYLAFLIVRESAVGATRPRFVDAAALRLSRDYLLEGIHTLALAPLGREDETESICEALNLLLPASPLRITAYLRYMPNQQAVAAVPPS